MAVLLPCAVLLAGPWVRCRRCIPFRTLAACQWRIAACQWIIPRAGLPLSHLLRCCSVLLR